MKTYLYVKTHNTTGLKYFGKTTKNDPFKYKGSGTYWKKHLKKHGNDISTEIIGIFENVDLCKKAALEFSQKYNITQSENWANLKDENGLDGSPVGVKFTKEHRDKLSQSLKGKKRKPFTAETIEKMSRAAKIKSQFFNPFSGKKGSELASKRNKLLIESGKHNFQQKGYVSVVNINGIGMRIPMEIYRNQTGNPKSWEYVSVTSKEAKLRRL